MQKVFKNNGSIQKKLYNDLKGMKKTNINAPLTKHTSQQRNFAFWKTFKYSLNENINKDPQLKESIDNFKESRDRFLNKYSIPKRYRQIKEFVVELPSNLGKIKNFIYKYTGFNFLISHYSIQAFRIKLAFKEAGRYLNQPKRSYEEDRLNMPKDDLLDKYADVFRKNYKYSEYFPAPSLVGAPVLLFFYIKQTMRLEKLAIWMENKMLRKYIEKEEAKDPEGVRETLKKWEQTKRRMFLTQYNEVGLIVYSAETAFSGYLHNDHRLFKVETDNLKVLKDSSDKEYDFKVKKKEKQMYNKNDLLIEDGAPNFTFAPYNPFGYEASDEFHKKVNEVHGQTKDLFFDWSDSFTDVDNNSFFRPKSFIHPPQEGDEEEAAKEEEEEVKEEQKQEETQDSHEISEIFKKEQESKSEGPEVKTPKRASPSPINTDTSTEKNETTPPPFETLTPEEQEIYKLEEDAELYYPTKIPKGRKQKKPKKQKRVLKEGEAIYEVHMVDEQPDFERLRVDYPEINPELIEKFRKHLEEEKLKTTITIKGKEYRLYTKEVEEEEDKRVREAPEKYVSERYVMKIEDYFVPLQYPEIMDAPIARTYHNRNAQYALVLYVSPEEQLERQKLARRLATTGDKPMIKFGHLLTQSKNAGLHMPAPPIKDTNDFYNYLYEYRMTHPDYVEMMEEFNIMDYFIETYTEHCKKNNLTIPTNAKTLRKNAFKHCYNNPGFYERNYFPSFIPEFFQLPPSTAEPQPPRIRPYHFHVLRVGHTWPVIDWEDPYYSKFKKVVQNVMENEEIFKKMYPDLNTEHFELMRESDNIFKPKQVIQDHENRRRYEKFTKKFSNLYEHPDFVEFANSYEEPWSTKMHKLHDQLFEEKFERDKKDLEGRMKSATDRAKEKYQNAVTRQKQLQQAEVQASNSLVELAKSYIERRIDEVNEQRLANGLTVSSDITSMSELKEAMREVSVFLGIKKILDYSRTLHKQEISREIKRRDDIEVIDTATQNLRSFEQQILSLSGRKTRLPKSTDNQLLLQSTDINQEYAKHSLSSNLEILSKRKKIYLSSSQGLVSTSTTDDEDSLSNIEKKSVISFLNQQLSLQETLLQEAEMDPGLLHQFIDSAPLFYFSKRVRQTHQMINSLNDFEYEQLIESLPSEWKNDLKSLRGKKIEDILQALDKEYSLSSYGSLLEGYIQTERETSLKQEIEKKIDLERSLVRLSLVSGVHDREELLKMHETGFKEDPLQESAPKEKKTKEIDFLKILTPNIIPSDTPEFIQMRRLKMDLVFDDLKFNDDIAPLPRDHPLSGQVVISDQDESKQGDGFMGTFGDRVGMPGLKTSFNKFREYSETSDNPILQMGAKAFTVMDQRKERKKAKLEKQQQLDMLFQHLYYYDPSFSFDRFTESVYKGLFPDFINMWYNFQIDKLPTYFSEEYLENAQSQLRTFIEAENVKPRIVKSPTMAEIIEAKEDTEYGMKVITVQVDYVRTAMGVVDLRSGVTMEQLRKEKQARKEEEEKEEKKKLEEGEKGGEQKEGEQKEGEQKDEEEKKELQKKQEEEDKKQSKAGLVSSDEKKVFGIVEGSSSTAFSSFPTVHAKGIFVFGFNEQTRSFQLLAFKEIMGMGVIA